MPRGNLLDLFQDLPATRGEFLCYDNGYRYWSYTYAQVVRAARGFAAHLQKNGLRKGDKVLLWAENRPEWVVAFWGCLLAGVVVVPIDYRASPDFLRRVWRIVGARLVLVGDDVPSSAIAGERFEALPDGIPIQALATVDWMDIREPQPVTAEPDNVAQIIFTSGATAEPKGVVITHRNILANIVPIETEVRKYRKWGRPFFPLRFLNLLPLSHMFGQAMAVFIPPMLPGTTVFIRGVNPAEVVRLISRRRVSVVVSVPKILDVLRAYLVGLVPSAALPPPEGEHVALRWWRYRSVHRLFGLKFWSFIVGAAPLDADLERFWSRLGFLVIQGYGLTETAPIVTLNHPFAAKSGSVGKAIGGVEVRIGPDGEILVRGENVTRGYYDAPSETARAFEDGWLHTGDIGELDRNGQLFIRGRKKEVMVTSEGLNVFPDDVERVLNQIPGVRESAAVGLSTGGGERVHAVLVLEPGTDASEVVKAANRQLADHQKIHGAVVWPGGGLPRTEGTEKLKRHEIRKWLETGTRPRAAFESVDPLESIVSKLAGGRAVDATTTIDELGLSSLERVELAVALEERFHTSIDEAALARARTVRELHDLAEDRQAFSAPAEIIAFPAWSRRALVRAIRRASLTTWILPLARLFAWIRVEGREHLERLEGPVIFAANHQSHLDTAVILAALAGRWRCRLAPAMAKEFFAPHFFGDRFRRRERFTSGLLYYLAVFFFNAFPIPQREAGARETLRYVGELLSEGWSLLIFPEGSRTETGEIGPFRPGVAMMASLLRAPVVPVRLEGVERVLHRSWRMPRPGRVRVRFGAPLELVGEDYARLAALVEEAVRRL
jgi:long-chain acyl-CoA synthetase